MQNNKNKNGTWILHCNTASLKSMKQHFENYLGGFPGGAAIENPPANAGDTGSSPGPGGFHMLQSN